jgi:hypothetical protein
MARHRVDMHMGHALTYAVVDGDKRSISGSALFDSPFQQLRMLEQGSDKGGEKVSKRLVMGLWHEQAVAGEKRPAIQKSQGEAIFIMIPWSPPTYYNSKTEQMRQVPGGTPPGNVRLPES